MYKNNNNINKKTLKKRRLTIMAICWQSAACFIHRASQLNRCHETYSNEIGVDWTREEFERGLYSYQLYVVG